MKAFKCDCCNEFYAYSPTGIFYDNSEQKRGVRYDLCQKCTEAVIEGILWAKEDHDNNEEE